MIRLELFVSGKLVKPFISNDLLERVHLTPRCRTVAGLFLRFGVHLAVIGYR